MSFVAKTILPTSLSAANDFFGWSLAANAERNSVIVGARTSTTTGKAYVYSYSPGADVFSFFSVLTANNRSPNDDFAASVAIDPQSVSHFFCGEPGKRRVLAFRNPTSITSTESYAITAGDYVTNYNRLSGFGNSMDIVNNNLLIGADGGDPNGLGYNTGAVYSMFLTQNSLSGYEQGQIITSPTPQSLEGFGFSVAVYGTDLVIGAPGATDGLNLNSGKVYYYTFNSSLSTWNYQQTITCPDAQAYAFFGLSVDVKGNYMAVGAPFATSQGISNNGKAYLYTKSGGLWANNALRSLAYTDVIIGGDTTSKNIGFSVALSSNPAMNEAVIAAGTPESYNFDTTLGRVGAAVMGVPGAGPWGTNGGYIVNRNPGPLSGGFTNLGRTINTAFEQYGFVLAGAPLPGKTVTNTSGAVYQIKQNFVIDSYPAATFNSVDPIVSVAGSPIPTVTLSFYVNNFVPVVNWTSSTLPAGVNLNPSTGVITGTIAAAGTYNASVNAFNSAGIATVVPIQFIVVTTSLNYGPIPSNRPISIGATAVGSSGGSLNLLLNRSVNQASSSLGEIEDRASHPLNLTKISDPLGVGTGVCVPNQIEKIGTAGGGGSGSWFPNGTASTYKPSRMSEFRSAYRWAMANIKPFSYTGAYTQNFTCGSKSRGPCPGYATLTVTVTTPASPAGDPYYWLFFGEGSAGANPDRAPNWSVALGGWVTRGAGYSDYVLYPAGSVSQGRGSTFTYTVRLKDTQGCGLIGNVVGYARVAYPGSTSG